MKLASLQTVAAAFREFYACESFLTALSQTTNLCKLKTGKMKDSHPSLLRCPDMNETANKWTIPWLLRTDVPLEIDQGHFRR